MAQIPGQGHVGKQLFPAGRLSEFQQRSSAQEVCFCHEIVVAAGLRGVEHLGDDGQPTCRGARRPHRVVNRELCCRQGAGIVRGGRQLHGPVRRFDDLGTWQAVRSVPQRAGQCRDHPGLQGQRAARRFQLLRGLTEKVEQLGVLRSRSVPECLHAECRQREPYCISGGPAGVGRLTEALHGQAGVPGPLVRRGELEQDLDALPGCRRTRRVPR